MEYLGGIMARHPGEDYGEALMCGSWLGTQVRAIVEDERVARVLIMPQQVGHLVVGFSVYRTYF